MTHNISLLHDIHPLKELTRVMVRAMLAGANMSTGFWAEALQYAVCILNAAPTKANNGISLAELWDGKPPRLAHLRPFGAHAYLHIPEEQLNKLQNVAKPVRYLGPARDTRHHHLWVPKSHSIMKSQNVVFIVATGMPEVREGLKFLVSQLVERTTQQIQLVKQWTMILC